MKLNIRPFIQILKQKQLFTTQSMTVHLSQCMYDCEMSGKRLGFDYCFSD